MLGKSFADAQLIFAGFGIQVNTANNNPGNAATLTLQGSSGSTAMLMADNTFIECSDLMDLCDAHPPLLTAPYILWQSPAPCVQFVLGSLVVATFNALGYPVPTPQGTEPTP